MRTSVVVDAGADLTTLWSPWGGTTSHPSLVAVDELGVVRAHGTTALLAKNLDDRLVLRSPFAGGDVIDQDLARSLLVRLMDGLVPRARKGSILFPLPTSTPQDVASHWRQLAAVVGGRPVFADRLTALALGLGLGADSEGAHLLIEVTADYVEIGIVSRGSVIAERTIRGEPESEASLVEVAGSMLLDIDPDDELDIRDEGLHLVAPAPESSGLARLLADGLGIPVLVTGSGSHPAVLGARQIVRLAGLYAAV